VFSLSSEKSKPADLVTWIGCTVICNFWDQNMVLN